MNTTEKLMIGLGLGILVMLLSFATIVHSMDKRESQKRFLAIAKLVAISEEWAYFEGQKEAINGDVRIKYDSESKTYSWTKSCWDDGMTPTFDPSQSENISYFLTKPNLTK
jgi:hypothetical protein